MYNAITDYYFDSEPSFWMFVDMLFTNGLYYTVEKDNAVYEYLAEPVVKFIEHMQQNDNFPHLNLGNNETMEIFGNGYSDIQLFSIVFARFFELDDAQMKLIEDKENASISFLLLRAFLCGATADNDFYNKYVDFSFSFARKRRKLNKIKYNGVSYVRKLPIGEYDSYSYPWSCSWAEEFDKNDLEEATF